MLRSSSVSAQLANVAAEYWFWDGVQDCNYQSQKLLRYGAPADWFASFEPGPNLPGINDLARMRKNASSLRIFVLCRYASASVLQFLPSLLVCACCFLLNVLSQVAKRLSTLVICACELGAQEAELLVPVIKVFLKK